MNVAFITPTPPDISAFGVRALSAFLRERGCRTRVIFLPGGIEKLRHGRMYRYRYPESVLQRLVELVSGFDVVGLSFMSQYRDRAIQITERLRRDSDTFVIWGGIHAEVAPRDALAYAHAACLTEGERVFPALLERLESAGDVRGVQGLVTREAPEEPAEKQLPFVEDLDTLPFIDMSLEDHWILEPRMSKIVPMTPEILSLALPLMPAPGGGSLTVYRTMTSRGCPHRCAYCANQAKARRFPPQKYLRFRSPAHVMRELHDVTRRYPFIQGIHFFDDVLTAMPERDLETLCRRVKDEIGLPYYVQASPSTITEDQLDMFIETGMVFIEMGIQTGSPAIQKMYRRVETREQVMRAAHWIHRRRKRLIPPHYHVILDNPWETRNDVRATLDIVSRIPGKFKLCLASLTFYPGTELYYRARDAGLIRDEESEIFQKPFFIPKGRYLNYLIYLADISWIPGGVLRWLGGAPADILDAEGFGGLFDLARRVTDKLRLAGKGMKALITGDFRRIFNYVFRAK